MVASNNSIKSANAYANNSVAFIAWVPSGPIKDCLGFEVTRIYGDGTERILAAWVPFEGQDNKDWKPQDTSVWPVQKFWWRDLTVRRRRDEATLRPADDTVKYRIRALVPAKPGLTPVPVAAPQTYTGKPVPLAYLDDGIVTNTVTITSDFGPIKAAFNNGILSTQWLSHAMRQTLKEEPTKDNLMAQIQDIKSPIRAYLGGDLPDLMSGIFSKLDQGGELYLALYELTDPLLFGLIKKYAGKVHLILTNTGMDTKTKEWDGENAPFRDDLQKAGLAEMHDRMFNNSAHIGHNKFAVYVDANGVPQSVLSGSTNWTPNGLCAQSNNTFVITSKEVANQYMTYWNGIKADNEAFTTPDPMSAGTSNAQGKDLRAVNAKPLDAILMQNQWALRLWRSPNTPQKTKPKNPDMPLDIQEIYYLMSQAKKAIFFAVFLPGMKGQTSIIELALALAEKNPKLMVYGAISSAMAMPNFISPQDAKAAGVTKPKQPTLYEKGNVHLVLASAITKGDAVGDFENELLSAGNAIIHDKIMAIDPVSDESVVVSGSHNLGYKASYANDDNLIVVRRNQQLAQAYAVHIMDLYDHYRFRAVQADRARGGSKPWSGFLATDGSWQDKYKGGVSDLVDYFGQKQK
jgi:hypothetical protein